MSRRLNSIWLSVLLAFATAGANAESPDAPALYREHCAACHGADRLGVSGPALLPESLSRMSAKRVANVIARGRPATQMPGFEDRLTVAEIEALANLALGRPAELPRWGIDEMLASHVVHNRRDDLPAEPVHRADPLNLFTVVETGDHHVTILDGDRFEPLWRFPTRFALHGGAKYSPDGRYVYLASRDGWISVYDLRALAPIAEIRAGINTRNLAVAGDGRHVMVANTLPNTLVVLDATDLRPVKIIPIVGDNRQHSRASAVYAAPPRRSFIVALKDIAEIWEISYDPKAPPVAKGWVHNYQPGMLEGAFDHGPFPVRRIKLDEPIDDFFFDQTYTKLIGASRDGQKGQVVNLNVGRKVAEVDLPGMPHLGSGITFTYRGRPVMATPHLKEGVVSIIDMTTWQTVRRIETLGPGFFMRGHKNTPYAWVDVFFGPSKDAVHVIDTRSLEIVKTLRPAPGKTAAHVEFTRDGRHALVSVWDEDGAVVVYDAATLSEVRRIPMNKPSGKYNVFNKITRSPGTSH